MTRALRYVLLVAAAICTIAAAVVAMLDDWLAEQAGSGRQLASGLC